MALRRAYLGASLIAAALACVGTNTLHAAGASAAATSLHVGGDFNGDGFADVAIGVPGAAGTVGAVNVLYGNAHGVSGARSEYWTLDLAGIPRATGKPGDRFGFSITSGDFNGDGVADLAIGVPGRNDVVILYGSANGLRSDGSQLLEVDGPVGAWALTSGDFNNDGFVDLAVGDPFATARAPAAGRVEVHYGSAAGLTATVGPMDVFSEATRGVRGPPPGYDDNFGLSLAEGDFNGDGFADLAVGVPHGNHGSGSAEVIYGSAAGLTTTKSQFLPTWGTGGGSALAAADFNRDGFADLVVGAPNTAISLGSGSIEVHYGSTTGLRRVTFGAAQLFAQETPGMPGPQLVSHGFFGFALAAGDFDGDGFSDLAISVAGDSAAIVLYGSAAGLTVERAQYLAGIGPHATTTFAPLGASVATADFTRSGYAALLMGEPFTDTTQPTAGVVEVFKGSTSGLAPTQIGAAQVLSGDTPGMAGPPAAATDNFGFSLSATSM